VNSAFAPEGCLGCNPDEVQPLLDEHGITVESIPTPQNPSTDILVCKKCGQAWLLMPRVSDTKKPVA
jgi:hypothetical protein